MARTQSSTFRIECKTRVNPFEHDLCILPPPPSYEEMDEMISIERQMESLTNASQIVLKESELLEKMYAVAHEMGMLDEPENKSNASAITIAPKSRKLTE